MIYEELLKHDPEAVTLAFRAFNRWLDEDWGFAYRDRIFAAPYLSLADLDWAVAELEWALARGARVVCMRPAAVSTADGTALARRSRCSIRSGRASNEAGITVVVHAGDSGYSSHGYAQRRLRRDVRGLLGPNVKLFHIERAITTSSSTLVFEQLFERFPNLRVASVENGSEFLPDLFRKLGSTAQKYAGWFREDPVETVPPPRLDQPVLGGRRPRGRRRSWAPTASSSAPTGRTSRACPQPLDYVRRARAASTTRARARSCATTPSS